MAEFSSQGTMAIRLSRFYGYTTLENLHALEALANAKSFWGGVRVGSPATVRELLIVETASTVVSPLIKARHEHAFWRARTVV